MLHDGQPQPRAANGPAVALIHPVKPFKHPALVIVRNADARVRHTKAASSAAALHPHAYAPAGSIVFNGIVAEVIDHLMQHLAHTVDRFLHTLQVQCHLLFPGHLLQTLQHGSA